MHSFICWTSVSKSSGQISLISENWRVLMDFWGHFCNTRDWIDDKVVKTFDIRFPRSWRSSIRIECNFSVKSGLIEDKINGADFPLFKKEEKAEGKLPISSIAYVKSVYNSRRFPSLL